MGQLSLCSQVLLLPWGAIRAHVPDPPPPKRTPVIKSRQGPQVREVRARGAHMTQMNLMTRCSFEVCIMRETPFPQNFRLIPRLS